MVSLRADPWTPAYGMGLEAAVTEEPALPVDHSVETGDWSTPISPPPADPCPLVFIDGVRRVDVRLWAEDEGRQVPGLFGSYAVGSVLCGDQATYGEERLARALVLGGGMRVEPQVVPTGKGPMRFEAGSAPGTDVLAPLAELQELMRAAESRLAAALARTHGSVVLADGPLSFLAPTEATVVGVVKRMVRPYLEAEPGALLPRLRTGDRTPLFALGNEPNARFAWYQRLAEVRPPWHDHAGIVRCEVRVGVGLEEARRVADRVASILPAFCGRPSDPRAPQNLAPVAALESRLRHRMGHPAFVRRALQAWLVRNG